MNTTRTFEVLEIFLLSALSLLSFVWGYNYHFHTSELWSVHIAGEFFNPNFKETIWIKPLFHFLLWIPHTIPLSDSAHLMLVKTSFAFNGVIQIVLSYLIFKSCCLDFQVSKYYSIFGVILLAANPFYLNFAFRIRSDLLATTIFLFFVYFRVCKNSFPIRHDLGFVVLFPLIGLKHIFFSLVAGAISLTSGKKLKFAISKHYVFALGSIAVLVWIVSLGWISVSYYLSTLNSYKDNFGYLLLWIKNDALLIVLGLIPIIATILFQTERNSVSKLRFLHVSALVYFVLVSQKFSFFVASLIPVFFLSTFLGLLILIEKVKFDYLAKALISIASFAYFLLATYNFKHYFPYHSNSEQIKFVQTVAPILHDQHLSVLDGAGIFPRVPNWNCFFSPDDVRATSYCQELIDQSKPPVIILTGRLLNLVSGDSYLEKLGYRNVGAGIFYSTNISTLEIGSFHKLPSAATTFGLEY